MKTYVIRLSGDKDRRYEFYNSSTAPVMFENGIIRPCMEGNPIPSEQSSSGWAKFIVVPIQTQERISPQYIHKFMCVENEEISKTTTPTCLNVELCKPSTIESIGNIHLGSNSAVFYMNEPRPELPVGLNICTYGELDGGKWLPLGFTTFSMQEMNVRSIGKPIYTRAGIKAIEQHHECNGSTFVHQYKGLGMIYLFGDQFSSQTLTSVFDGHMLHDMFRLHEYMFREQEEIDLIPKTELTTRYGRDQYAYPMQSLVLSLPPFPSDMVDLYRFPPGLSDVELVKSHLRIYRGLYTRGESFYYCRGKKAATTAWYEARLVEVLTVHGRTLDDFVKLVNVAKTTKVLCDEFKECLRIAASVLRIHSSTRPYVNDYTVIPWNGRIIPTDEETGGVALPRDCEDSAGTVKSFHATLLFGNVHLGNSVYVAALRSCAAMLGVPCVIMGTFADPLEDRGDGIAGHSYQVAMPFNVFAAQIGVSIPLFEFEREFGFSLPLFHTKPAILDAVEMSSSFYGDHYHMSEQKRNAMDKLMRWILKAEGGNKAKHAEWCWEKYTCEVSFSKQRRGQGHAFRMVTDIFGCMESWRPLNMYVFEKQTIARRNVNNSTFIPRSFVILSNLRDETDVERAFDVVYPVIRKDGSVNPTWRDGNSEDHLLFYPRRVLDDMFSQFKQCIGVGKMGICVEMLLAPRLYYDKPVFTFAALGTHVAASRIDERIRMAYGRPTVPLLNGNIRDEFITATPAPIIPYNVELPPSDPNQTIMLFIYRRTYDELCTVVDEISRKFHVSAVGVYPYGFGSMVIFHL